VQKITRKKTINNLAKVIDRDESKNMTENNLPTDGAIDLELLLVDLNDGALCGVELFENCDMDGGHAVSPDYRPDTAFEFATNQ